jgi:hypothetical protein
VFSDWQFFTANARINFSLDLVNPIIGTSSLKALLNNSAGDPGNGVVTVASGRTKGIEQGRMRTLIRTNTSATGGANANRYGIVCLQSANDMSIGSPNGYFLGYQYILSDFTIWRLTGQTLGSGLSIATLEASSWVTLGTTFAFMAEWIVDIANLGGVYFAISSGAATDFSDLAVRLTHIDPTGLAHTAGIAEGLGVQMSSFTGGIPYIQFDQTSLYSLQ